jgi:hypothetical protein
MAVCLGSIYLFMYVYMCVVCVLYLRGITWLDLMGYYVQSEEKMEGGKKG